MKSRIWVGQEVMDGTEKVNRLEVINHCKDGTGREYVRRSDDLIVEAMLQDDGRTLKIFLRSK